MTPVFDNFVSYTIDRDMNPVLLHNGEAIVGQWTPGPKPQACWYGWKTSEVIRGAHVSVYVPGSGEILIPVTETPLLPGYTLRVYIDLWHFG